MNQTELIQRLSKVAIPLRGLPQIDYTNLNVLTDIEDCDEIVRDQSEYEYAGYYTCIEDNGEYEDNVIDAMREHMATAIINASRNLRIALCGQVRHRTMGEDKRTRTYYYRCNCYECQHCRRDKAEEENARMVRALGNNYRLRMMKIKDENRQEFSNRIKKSGRDYRYIPSEDGDGFAYTDDMETELDDLVEKDSMKMVRDQDEIDKINWDEVMMTGKKRRRSGKLGKSATLPKTKRDPDSPTIKVKTPEYTISGLSTLEAQAALIHAEALTKDLTLFLPNGAITPLSFSNAMQKWIRTFQNSVAAYGGELRITRWISETLEIKYINWGNDNILYSAEDRAKQAIPTTEKDRLAQKRRSESPS